jgi:hypothetical protein
LTVEVDDAGLRIGNFQMPVDRYSPHATPPAQFQVFPVTDLSALFPDKPPPEPWETDTSLTPWPPPQIADGVFPIADEEFLLVEEATRLARYLCALPKVKPAEIAGLAHALFALERLSAVTKGVDVEFNLGVRSGAEESYSERWVTTHISEQKFSVGTISASCDEAAGGDDHRTTVFQVENTGYRSIPAGDERAWTAICDWFSLARGMIEQSAPEDLKVLVRDDSNPACIQDGLRRYS